MTQLVLIEQELTEAEEAKKIANKGKARVCARWAVALADEVWLATRSDPPFHGDTLTHLRRIQQVLLSPFHSRSGRAFKYGSSSEGLRPLHH